MKVDVPQERGLERENGREGKSEGVYCGRVEAAVEERSREIEVGGMQKSVGFERGWACASVVDHSHCSVDCEKGGHVEIAERAEKGDALDLHDLELLINTTHEKSTQGVSDIAEKDGEGELEGEELDWVVEDANTDSDGEESGDQDEEEWEVEEIERIEFAEETEEEWEVEDFQEPEEENIGTPVEPTSDMRRRRLSKYEIKCPPGGEEGVVVYTTSLGGIRKTFADCNNVRQIMEGFRLQFDERDISMHSQFRTELSTLMGGPSKVPQLFIRGYHIGGVDEVVRLSEESELDVLLEGIPRVIGTRKTCDACGGLKFIPCPECSGSHKVVYDDGTKERCPDCNEYGLALCPLCTTCIGG